MKRFKKIYLEITNICNLSCSFCPGTERSPKMMSEAEFSLLINKLLPYSDYLYYHLMGEPLLHPEFGKFLKLAGDTGFRNCITTNGTLLSDSFDIFRENAQSIHKVSISLQAMEGNGKFDEDYLDNCFSFGKSFEGSFIISYRLWNEGGADSENENILAKLREYFPEPWKEHRAGYTIGNRVFLEFGENFEWPDGDYHDEHSEDSPKSSRKYFCYALRDQIGVLSDGTVVPCCLDSNGSLALGSLYERAMDSILASPRAVSIYEGFSRGEAVESMCRGCGYASRFAK